MLIGWGQNELRLCAERGYEGRVREVLQEDVCSSMYSNYYTFVVLYLHLFTYRAIIPAFRKSDHNVDWCLFWQVKNKPWRPWVYTWIWHRREQGGRLLLRQAPHPAVHTASILIQVHVAHPGPTPRMMRHTQPPDNRVLHDASLVLQCVYNGLGVLYLYLCHESSVWVMQAYMKGAEYV